MKSAQSPYRWILAGIAILVTACGSDEEKGRDPKVEPEEFRCASFGESGCVFNITEVQDGACPDGSALVPLESVRNSSGCPVEL